MNQHDNTAVSTPPTKVTRNVLLACWLAILFEGYDVGVMGAILPSLAEYRAWDLSPIQLGILSSYALMGMFFGSFIMGSISDFWGRKRVLILCVTLFSLTMFAAALAPTPTWFAIFRFIGGLGLGGVIPVAATLTVEYSPPERRAFNYGLMYSGYSLGILCAALVAIWLLPTYSWRIVVAVGGLPILAVGILFKLLPESLDFLVSRGQLHKAEVLAKRLAMKVPEQLQTTEKLPWKSQILIIFSRRYISATVCFWIALFCSLLLVYGLNTWLPSIMRQQGYNLGSSLSFLAVFSLSSAIGGLCLGGIADRIGDRKTMTTAFLVGALAILSLMNPFNLIITYILVGLSGIGSISASLVLTSYLAKYYPPSSRASGTGWALGFSRLGTMSGPIIGAYIVAANASISWNFIAFALICLIAAIAAALIPRNEDQ